MGISCLLRGCISAYEGGGVLGVSCVRFTAALSACGRG